MYFKATICFFKIQCTFNNVRCIYSPAADICHSWWTRAHEGLGVCGSWRTATGPEWWQVWSGCGYQAYEQAGGPAWTEGAGLNQEGSVISFGCPCYAPKMSERQTKPPSIYLVVQHEQDGAANTHITGPLHLETIRFLGGGSPVPLKWDEGHFNYKCLMIKI